MAIASHILDLQLEGLPIDYPTKRDEWFKAVTLTQANELARKWLGGGDLFFLSVGKVTPKTAPKTEQLEVK
jgi:predicted Zn-dependent peptidase